MFATLIMILVVLALSAWASPGGARALTRSLAGRGIAGVRAGAGLLVLGGSLLGATMTRWTIYGTRACIGLLVLAGWGLIVAPLPAKVRLLVGLLHFLIALAACECVSTPWALPIAEVVLGVLIILER